MDRIDRIATIGSSILTQAETESKALIEKANGIRERELASAEEKIIAEMGEHMQRETARIRAKAASDIATERTRARESLLCRRAAFSGEVFSRIEKRLADYVRTEEYGLALLREIGSVKDAYDHGSSTVYLREEDMGRAAAIRGLLPGCKVEQSAGVRIGGWQLRNDGASVLIDQSFGARLRDQKSWFLENCNLEVTG